MPVGLKKEKQEKHIHKLKRIAFKSGNKIYFCTLPDCNYKLSTTLSLGKRALCWRCGNSFIMNEYSIRLAKPHCENCHKFKLEEKPWIHVPSIEEKEATKELAKSLTLGEKLAHARESITTESTEDDI